jgi:uncharacterized protein YbjT (DUF2867 family)
MTNTTNNTILVIGSTGKTGKRVAAQLGKRGIPIRHGSRSADIPFDWHNPQTWAPALAGVDKVYITYHPDLAVPGSVDAVAKLTELARDAGASRLMLLSGRNEAEAERAERVVMASWLEWTIVRCAFFAQNFNEGAWLDEVLAGTGTRAQGLRRLRPRHRYDRSVDAVSLNLGERISVEWRDPLTPTGTGPATHPAAAAPPTRARASAPGSPGADSRRRCHAHTAAANASPTRRQAPPIPRSHLA